MSGKIEQVTDNKTETPANRSGDIGEMPSQTPINIPSGMKEEKVRSLIGKYFPGVTLEIKIDLAKHNRHFIVGKNKYLQDLENLLKIDIYRYPQTSTSYIDHCLTCDEKINGTYNCLGCPAA